MASISLWRAFALAAALMTLPLAGCGGGDSTDTSSGDAGGDAGGDQGGGDQGGEDGGAAEAPTKIDIDAVRDTARTAMFVPAPTEFQAALTASKVDIDLRKLLEDSSRSLEGKSRSIIALEAGVRLSNVLMTAADGDKAQTLARMRSAREALGALQLPADLLAEADKVIGDFEKGAISPAELVPALDVLNERIQDDLVKGNDPNTATLVQAGGWLQGAHLLSRSLADSGTAGDAAALLRQPTVLAHFKDFLNKSGAGDPRVDAVLAEMTKLEELAAKPELGADDMSAVATHTGNILAQF